jgi:LuxR family maltose regulon positive regulatory protein
VSFCNSKNITVDCKNFIDETKSVRATILEKDPKLNDENAEKLRKTLTLYKGEFLEGFNLKDCPEFDQWQTLMRDELIHQISWVLERLVEYDSAEGRWEESIEQAQHWLALDNLNETAHRTLMFLFARSGKRSAALHQYETCCRLLREELEQEPDEQTITLAERIRLRKIDASKPTSTVTESRPQSSVYTPPVDVLHTKITPPQVRANRVNRSRLFSLLEEGITRPLTLIAAPAGFGKTTMLSEWVQERRLPAAWISLEQNDNEPARLLSTIASALGTLGAKIGTDALNMLRSMQLPAMSAIVESITTDLCEKPEARVLVLDDYHLIHNKDIHELVSQFIEQMPADFHLFISTRVDPILPLARLRARDQLVEVRAEELRFSKTETASFLREVMGLELTDEDILTLEQRTEGWAAGLQMAALSLRRHTDRARFIKDFSGSHRYIMDYLVGEVMDNQPMEVQEFLLKTSILKRFCAELCDEVVQSTGSQPLLEELERGNLFLVALDEKRVWYRYHHLFSELLQHRLRLAHAGEDIAKLHLQAARWFEKENDIESGMFHYLESDNYTEALRVIGEQLGEILKHGGLGMLLSWTERIPDEAVAENPEACVNVGIICTFAGRAEEAEKYFTMADKFFDTDEGDENSTQVRTLRGQVSAMRAFIADVAGRTTETLELAHKAEELLPDELVMTRSLVPYILSRVYRHKGDLERSEAYLEQQMQLALKADNPWSFSGAIHEMVWLCRLRGKLFEAERFLDMFDDRFGGLRNRGPIAKIIAARAEIARERGNLKEATRIIGDALQAVEGWGLPSDVCFCLQTSLRIKLSFGDAEGAARDLARIDEIVRTSPVHKTILPLYEAERVRIFLALGKVSQAIAWLHDYNYDDEDSPINREVIMIARARILLAQGNYSEACELLDRLAGEADAGRRYGRLLEILVLRATAGTKEGSNGVLPRALELAEPEQYLRVFLDEGEPLVFRLRGILDCPGDLTPRLADYVRHLLSFQSNGIS